MTIPTQDQLKKGEEFRERLGKMSNEELVSLHQQVSAKFYIFNKEMDNRTFEVRNDLVMVHAELLWRLSQLPTPDKDHE